MKRQFVLVAALLSFGSIGAEAQDAEWPLCATIRGKPYTCIVDGDSFWMHGQPYRVYGVSAPRTGLQAHCEAEKRKAEEAIGVLQYVLKSGGLTFTSHGLDSQGWNLVTIRANKGDAAVALIKSNNSVDHRRGNPDVMRWCR